MSDERVEVETGASRRALFLGAGAAGATAILAACGTEGTNGGAPPPATPGGTTPGDTSPGEDDGGDDGGDQGEDGEVLLTTGEVEVGGGVILSQETVVVTQPTEGEFKGFSAACTHEGCIVSSVSDGMINCGCHGSQYSIEDGSVQRAAPGLTPETQNPLPPVEISVDGSNITKV